MAILSMKVNRVGAFFTLGAGTRDCREKKKAESEAYWRNVNRKNSEPEIEEYDESSGSSSRNLILGLFAAGYSIYKIVTYFKRRK